jgi:hypothetical protein
MSATPSSAAPAAVSAFLKGVERRGLVLAELQSGSASLAEKALIAALRAFRTQAATLPMAGWPDRFWRLLAAMPQLRQPGDQVPKVAGFEALHDTSGPRLALLLRLVAGLDEDAAAAAMSTTLQGYRIALAEGCPRDAEGEPDAEGWRALAEAIQQRLRNLEPATLQRLEQLREVAIVGREPAPPPMAVEPAPRTSGKPKADKHPRRRGFRWSWIAALLLLVGAVAIVAGYYLRSDAPARPRTTPQARAEGISLISQDPPAVAEPLGDAPAPQPGPPSSADARLLADPQGRALAARADVLAWYAAGAVDATTRQDDVPEATAPETEEDRSDATL